MNIKISTKRLAAIALLVAAISGISAYAQSIVPQKDEKKGLWGYVSKDNGKWLVKPKFDEATELTTTPNGQLRGTVTQKGKKGFVDDSGKILGAGIVFEEITPMQGDAMFVKVKGKTGVSDYNGVYKVKPEVENVEQLGNEGWIVTLKGKKGILKNDGTWLIEPIYTNIDHSINEYFVVDAGGKAGLLRRDGTPIVVPKDFTSIAPMENSYWIVKKGNKAGLLEISTNKLVVNPNYDAVLGVYNDGNVYLVKNGKNIEFLNKQGKRTNRVTADKVVKVEELPSENALIVFFGIEDPYIYLNKLEKAYPITINTEDFFGFKRGSRILRKDCSYSTEDKNNLAPYLKADHYYNSLDGKGKTKYTSGKLLYKNLFYMEGPDGRDLYKIGESKSIGEIENINGFYILLKSGQMLNGYCEPVELLSTHYQSQGSDANVYYAIKNIQTGKYLIADGIVGGPIKILSNEEYDMLVRTPRFYIGRQGNKLYKIDKEGENFEEWEDGSYLELPNGIIMDGNGKFGVKNNKGLVVMEPTFDDYSGVGTDYLKVWKDGKVGLYDLRNYKLVMEPIFDDFAYFYTINYEYGNPQYDDTDFYMVWKDGKAGLYDIKKRKMAIPFEKGYTTVAVKKGYKYLQKNLYDSDLCYVQIGDNEDKDKIPTGLWNLKLGKEVLAPSADNKIDKLPDGYKGFSNNGVAYNSNGTKLSLSPAVDVYQAEWGNDSPYFFTKLTGLEGRTVDFYITAYKKDGSIYKNPSGQNCVYKCKSDTPTSAIEYGPQVSAWVKGDILLHPFSSITLKFVLSAKDAKTGASIPVKGEKSITSTFSRDW